MNPRSKNHEQGSIMIIVLVLMMVSVSLALYTVTLSRDVIRTSGQLMDKLQAKLEAESLAEKVKFIGATGQFSSWQLANPGGLLGCPLQMNLRGDLIELGNSELRLQDSGGRFGLWMPQLDLLRRFLLLSGAKSEEAAVAMDSLHDWIDEDDLKRLNGAEKYYYHNEQAYAYLPRNDKFIQSLDELLLIKGMPGKIFELLKSEILETTPAAININTASAPVLAAAANIDLENARRFLQVRDKKGEVSLNDLLVATGKKLTFEDDYVTAFPSLTLDVDIRTRVNEAGDKVRLLVRFTPDRERPYTVEKFDQ